MLYRDYRYVDGYSGYIVSNFGEIFSTKGKKVIQLKACLRNDGYLNVILCENCKARNYAIHVLVGNAFIGLRTGEFTFDHIDRIRTNNRADNIQLATKSEQSENRGIQKNNKSGFENITNYNHNGNEYYKLQIDRKKKSLIRQCYKKTDYNIEDVAKIRDDVLAKYNHEVCLNKVHIELLSITDFVRSV